MVGQHEDRRAPALASPPAAAVGCRALLAARPWVFPDPHPAPAAAPRDRRGQHRQHRERRRGLRRHHGPERAKAGLLGAGARAHPGRRSEAGPDALAAVSRRLLRLSADGPRPISERRGLGLVGRHAGERRVLDRLLGAGAQPPQHGGAGLGARARRDLRVAGDRDQEEPGSPAYAGAASTMTEAIITGLFGVELGPDAWALTPRLGSQSGGIHAFHPPSGCVARLLAHLRWRQDCTGVGDDAPKSWRGAGGIAQQCAGGLRAPRPEARPDADRSARRRRDRRARCAGASWQAPAGAAAGRGEGVTRTPWRPCRAETTVLTGREDVDFTRDLIRLAACLARAPDRSRRSQRCCARP